MKTIFVNPWGERHHTILLFASHSFDLTKPNEEVLTALRCSNRFMRVLNPGQFQQVWNFLNFPAKISPRMSVEGERGRRGARTYLALIPADRGHVQSHLSTQPRILAIPYFHRIWQMQNAPLPKLRFSYWWKIFVWQVINHRRNIWFDNCCCQRETFRTEKLTSISSPNFTPSGWVHNYCSLIYLSITRKGAWDCLFWCQMQIRSCVSRFPNHN